MNTGPVVVEQQGSHHVAWMRAENGQAHRSVLMVGKTPEEAEARLSAYDWSAAAQRAAANGRGDWADALLSGRVGRTEAEACG